jgi:hypothetical protein
VASTAFSCKNFFVFLEEGDIIVAMNYSFTMVDETNVNSTVIGIILPVNGIIQAAIPTV